MKKKIKPSKFTKSIIALSAILLFVTLNAQTQTKEQLVISLSRPDKPFKLRLGLENGAIKVIAYNGKDILIDAEPLAEKIEKGEPNQNQNNNNNNNTNINIHEGKIEKGNAIGGRYLFGKENNNNITLSQVTTNKILNVVIKVPKNSASLNLSIVNKGNILIADIIGEIEVSGNTGSVNLKNVSGSAVVNTVTGNITVSFKTVEPKAMAFSTLVGNIDLTFPASVKTNIKLKSEMGELYTDFDLEQDKSQPDAKPQPQSNPKANQAGQAKYKINNTDWVYGKINQGGFEMLTKNMQGNIYIRKAK